jgi:hypothetical protein
MRQRALRRRDAGALRRSARHPVEQHTNVRDGDIKHSGMRVKAEQKDTSLPLRT